MHLSKNHQLMFSRPLFLSLTIILLGLIAACAPVGPNFETPVVKLPEKWHAETTVTGLENSVPGQPQWWQVFNDAALNQLVELAWQQNNNLEIAGLRILQARAQLGIAQGSQYPQSQFLGGNTTYSAPANNAGGSHVWRYGLAASISWEMDFWGKFRRGIEAADAAYLASLAARDQALLLITAQVVSIYTIIRINEEQLKIARDNVAIQQRSFEITSTLYRNGYDSELDMQQAQTLLLSTEATIPGFEIALKQAINALNTLLGLPPGGIDKLLGDSLSIPSLPETVEIGLPADLLRRRPDVRQAELNAMALNARVGFASADLYPSFSLTGSLGLSASTQGSSNFGDLFSSDALGYSIGPSFVWPFFNYGRIKNNIRVQDALLQQALVNYREVAIQAAREAEDALVAFDGAQRQTEILLKTVASAERSNKLALLRYKEGFSGYQRVLDSQQALFTQQQRLVAQRGSAVLDLVSLYKALGGGWEGQASAAIISPQSREAMTARTDWGELLEPPSSKTAIKEPPQ